MQRPMIRKLGRLFLPVAVVSIGSFWFYFVQPSLTGCLLVFAISLVIEGFCFPARPNQGCGLFLGNLVFSIIGGLIGVVAGGSFKPQGDAIFPAGAIIGFCVGFILARAIHSFIWSSSLGVSSQPQNANSKHRTNREEADLQDRQDRPRGTP